MPKFPVNNDRITPSNHAVHKGDAMSVKDTDGDVVLNVMRYYFGTGAEARRRAVAFARALVALLNDAHKEGRI